MQQDTTTATEPLTKPPIHNLKPNPESKKTKLINKALLVALVVIAISLFIMLRWAAANPNVLSLNKEPFPVRTIREHPTAGGVVFLTTDFCKNTNALGELRPSFVSETREIFLPMTIESSNKGCHDIELPILIPKDIQPDEYKVKLRFTYDINPLKQNIVQEFYSYPVIIDPENSTNGLPLYSNLNAREERASNSEQ